MKYLKRIVWVLFLIVGLPLWVAVMCFGTIICSLLGIIRHIFTWNDFSDDLVYYLFKYFDYIVELPEKIMQEYRPE